MLREWLDKSYETLHKEEFYGLALDACHLPLTP